jgi:hypothetical protein
MFKNERRVFRGRGGPNDRRLPKHNARRRRKHPSGNTDLPNQPIGLPVPSPVSESDGVAARSARQREFVAGVEQSLAATLSIVALSPPRVQRVDCSTLADQLPDAPCTERVSSRDRGQGNRDELNNLSAVIDESSSLGYDERFKPVASHDRSLGGTWDEQFRAETNHLRTRIANNQRTMQRSASSLKHPENYQRHVLDAVHNTVREYRAIFRNYSTPSAPDSHPIRSQEGCDDELDGRKGPRFTANQQYERKELGNGLFILTQQALQCGPLAGSKAGYMKRCDPPVVRRVLQFLEGTFPDDQGSSSGAPLWLDWTNKQFEALQSWKSNARRAYGPIQAEL